MLNQKEVNTILNDHYKDYSIILIKYCQVKTQDTNVSIFKYSHLKEDKKGTGKNKCSYINLIDQE